MKFPTDWFIVTTGSDGVYIPLELATFFMCFLHLLLIRCNMSEGLRYYCHDEPNYAVLYISLCQHQSPLLFLWHRPLSSLLSMCINRDLLLEWFSFITVFNKSTEFTYPVCRHYEQDAMQTAAYDVHG